VGVRNKASPPQAAGYLSKVYVNLIATGYGELHPIKIKPIKSNFLGVARGKWVYQIACLWLSWIDAFRNPRIVSILPIFQLKNFVNIRTGQFFSQGENWTFKSTNK